MTRREASCFALCMLAAAIAGAPSYAGVRVCQALAGSSPATTGAAVLDAFSDASGQPAQVQTRAGVSRDAAALHFTVQCQEPRMDHLVAKCHQDRDSSIFQDDCLELFLSTTGAPTGYLHFVTNANGTRWEERGRGGVPWTGRWEVEASRAADAWTVQLTIPFATVGARPERGEVWWLNLCRQRQAGGELQLSAWSPTRDNFHDTTCFGALVFDGAYAGYLTRTILAPWDGQVAELRERAKSRRSLTRSLDAALAQPATELGRLRKAAQSATPPSLSEFGDLLAIGRAQQSRLAQVESDLSASLADADRLRALRTLTPPGAELLVWTTPAITDRRVLPVPDPPGSVATALALRACRGEHEAASFVVWPPRREMTLEVVATDLRGPTGVIPAASVDVRAVKCWYQSGGNERFPINHGLHLMTPELLLRDDDLVRVDTVGKRNLVKLQYPDGTRKWVDVSTPTPSPEEKDSSAAVFPIRDAATLQPITVPARGAKQFWITVHVPADARSGRYVGSMELAAAGRVVAKLPLQLEVLPFDLAPNPLESSIYFHWGFTLDERGPGTLTINRRSTAQFRAELADLLAHGVDNPTIGVPFDSGQLPLELKLRQEAGMRHDRLYYLVANTWHAPEQLKKIIEMARGFGFTEFYFYGADEAVGDKLTEQRKQWQQVHDLGGKVFVAGQAGQNFPLVGDLQDLLVCYGDPTRAEAAKWHSKGHKIFCYANPQGGIEAPETYRRNFGLLLAANNYDGGMTYIYYSGTPSWDDWAIPPYRQHNFVYPTADGVIDTVQWEGYREGIDDLRYLGTLRQAIAEAKAAGHASQAAAAQAFMDHMDVTGDLYALRDQMITWILRLRAGR